MTNAYRILLVFLLTGYLLALGPATVSAAPPAMPDFTPLGGIADRNVTASDVATDARGNVYLTDVEHSRVVVYTPSGRVISTFSTAPTPVSVAVAADGTVYVGSVKDGSVTAYTGTGTFQLGVGAGEFKYPIDIQVDSAGKVYVADMGSNEVLVYGPDGIKSGSIGTAGAPGTVIGTTGILKPAATQGDGENWKPRSVAINEAASEVIVLDRQQVWDKDTASQLPNGRFVYGAWVDGVRVQVYSLDGTFLRGYNLFGYKSSGEITAPPQLTVDRIGRIYISVPGENKVKVYGEDIAATPVTLINIGSINNSANKLYQPTGITISDTNILYVVNRFGFGKPGKKVVGVQAFGLDNFSTAVITPSPLKYEAVVDGANPAPQSITIENPGTVDVVWNATADSPWISLAATTGTVPPGTTSPPLAINVDVTSMQPGSYSGLIAFTTDSGLADQVKVELEVKENPLVVNPLSITLNSQVDKTPTAQKINISSTAGELSWTSTADVNWISLSPASGVTPATVSLSVDTTGMTEGTYNGIVTFDYAGSTVDVAVTLVLDPNGTVVDTPPTLQDVGPGGMDINGTYWKVDRLNVPDGLNLNGVWGKGDEQLVIVGDQGFAVRMDDDELEPVDTSVAESLRAVWGSEKKSYYAVGDSGSILSCKEDECEVLCSTEEPMTDIWGVRQIKKVHGSKDEHKEKKGKKEKKEKKTKRTYQIMATSVYGTVAAAPTCTVNASMGTELRSLWGDKFDNFYAVGTAGQMFNFDGTAWNDESFSTSNGLNAIWGRSHSDIYVVGDSGVIFHKDGSGWTEMNSGTTENLYGVWGAEEDIVYAVGDKGTVLVYENGQWTTVITGGTDIVLRDVWASDDNVVYAVGDNGTVLMGIGPEEMNP